MYGNEQFNFFFLSIMLDLYLHGFANMPWNTRVFCSSTVSVFLGMFGNEFFFLDSEL